MKTVTTALILLLAAAHAWAIDIHSAKDQGLVGEARSGYLAAVKTPASADVESLIRDVNAKRRAQFERTATKTSATLVQVSNRFYELAVQRTAVGHYYQNADGRWVRK